MKKRTLPLLLSMAIAPAAFSAIYLDGANISNDVSITSRGGNIYIETGGTTQPEPEEPTPVDPTPVDPTPPPVVDNGSCGSANSEMVFETLNWSKQPGATNIDIPKTATISSCFTTTGTNNYAGTIVVAPSTGTGYVGRNIWISNTPGGPAIPQAYDGCEDTAAEARVKWSQEASPRSRSACKLAPNTTYFLNYRNVGCNAGSCDAYRQMYSVGG